MARIIKVKAQDGSTIEYLDEIIGSGAIKDVYFEAGRKNVVAFFRGKQDANTKDRIANIVGNYREKIFQGAGGEYWNKIFCWPTKIIEDGNRLGIVVPTYPNHFFFEFGSKNNDFLKIKGKEKEGKWFASASNQSKFLDNRERGNWSSYLRICLLISRGVRRLHAAGLAHSDLSYKNVLVDPKGGNASIIDIDGLVVPGKYPPEVVGTPDFIAPEVYETKHLAKNDPLRKLPSIATDRHALAVLVYMYLLYRHPLRGAKVNASDPQKDEELSMGEKALFIEHPKDFSNKPNLKSTKPSYLPWADVSAVPYTIAGPILKQLFDKAFIQGLHNPNVRPTADEWEQALVKSVDLLVPCTCDQKWFILGDDRTCPFCRARARDNNPIIEFLTERGGSLVPENHKLVVYHNLNLFRWHTFRNVFPNEKLPEGMKRPVGYFAFHNGKWILVNQELKALFDNNGKEIAIGSSVELTSGTVLHVKEEHGRSMKI